MQNDIIFRSDSTVELVDSMGGDHSVVRAARVSTGADMLKSAPSDTKGLIGYLMKNRHGSPFEAAVFQFRIECPIFTAREFMRHRMASYNEESARYKQLDAVFWVPAVGRGVVQAGSSAHPSIVMGTPEQQKLVREALRESATVEYRRYERLLEAGIAREVARACLTVSVYTSFYVTMNARALMNFLSLRIDSEEASYPTKPQAEIEETAFLMEDYFAEKMPVTHNAFCNNGRVAP